MTNQTNKRLHGALRRLYYSASYFRSLTDESWMPLDVITKLHESLHQADKIVWFSKRVREDETRREEIYRVLRELYTSIVGYQTKTPLAMEGNRIAQRELALALKDAKEVLETFKEIERNLTEEVT